MIRQHKHKTILKIVRFSLICCLIFEIFAYQVTAGNRNKVVVYPYSGPNEGFKFDNFYVFLDTNTGNLMEAFELEVEENAGNISPISGGSSELFVPAKIEPLPSMSNKIILSKNEKEKIWNNDHTIIEILGGTIIENPSQSGYTILSRVYSKLFSKDNKFNQITLIEDSSKHLTREFLGNHHMVLFFAFAMDAKYNKKPSWLITKFLRKAQEFGDQIDTAKNPTSSKIIERIHKELEYQEEKSK